MTVKFHLLLKNLMVPLVIEIASIVHMETNAQWMNFAV